MSYFLSQVQSVLIFVGVLVAVVFIGTFIMGFVLLNKRKLLLEVVREIANQHAPALARRRSQLVTKDDYGRVRRDLWDREILMFLEEIVGPAIGSSVKLDSSVKRLFVGNDPDAIKIVDEIAEVEESRRVSATEYRDDLDPKEFEVFCATALNRLGWSARATGRTGDQGADVIAEKDGRRVVIQCKKYSGAVGNFAVQEAHAAKAHYRADIAVVVTNATFTPSAKALAQTTSVMLMHPTDLADFDHQLTARA